MQCSRNSREHNFFPINMYMQTRWVYKSGMHMRQSLVAGSLIGIISVSLFFFAQSVEAASLFSNSSVETASGSVPANWTSEAWGTTKATFTYPTGGAQDGNRYVKTQVTTKGTGDAKWYPTHINATAGQTFSFSDWYQSNVGSIVEVEVLLQNGSYSYLRLATPAAAANWTKYTGTFTTPANTKSITVFHFIQAVGALSVDNYELTSGSTPPPDPFVYALSNAGNRTVTVGASTTTTITATLSLGTTQAITFGISALPSGTTATFSQASCSPTCTTTLTFASSAAAATGTFPIVVSGSAGTTTKTTSFNLIVSSAATSSSQDPGTGTNVVKNPSVETVQSNNTNLPQNWAHEKWGTLTTTFTYVKNDGHTGSKSVKVQISSYTDGDAKWMPDAIAVTPGDSYRLTDWYKSDIENYPVIEFALTDGTSYYLGLRPQDPSATWTQFSESFQVPAKAKTMRVMHLISAKGYLSLDDVSLTKITPHGFTRAIVTLNFDDGWEDDTISVLPVLNNKNFKATWFFATTYLENSPQTGAINVSGPSAVHALFNDGQEIGGHTVTHPDLTTLSDSDLNYELTHSKQYLEGLVGAGNVTSLATPYGTYSDQVIETAKSLYTSLRSTDEGFNTGDDFDMYRLEVQNMQKTTTLDQFKSWVDQAKKDKSWLIIVYHRVASSNLEDFDTPVADFGPQMDYLKSSGVTVLPTQTALNEIKLQLGL
jgi:peptidoglycan/xylan/chitin deacetylase (PgdA/CDA1 family)